MTNNFGITTTCSASITVNQDVVGINYEDWSDWDYNDSVVCATGYLQINGKQIVSHAFHSGVAPHELAVRPAITAFSFGSYDQWNNVRRSIQYTSAVERVVDLRGLEPNWRIDRPLHAARRLRLDGRRPNRRRAPGGRRATTATRPATEVTVAALAEIATSRSTATITFTKRMRTPGTCL